jgi:hypothetical protein
MLRPLSMLQDLQCSLIKGFRLFVLPLLAIEDTQVVKGRDQTWMFCTQYTLSHAQCSLIEAFRLFMFALLPVKEAEIGEQLNNEGMFHSYILLLYMKRTQKERLCFRVFALRPAGFGLSIQRFGYQQVL